MRIRTLTLGVVVVLALAGCSGKSHDAAPTTRPASSTTAATGSAAGAPNPDVIPPVITVAYVNAVFAVLNHINGNAARSLVSANQITPVARADLRAIYNDPLFTIEMRVAQQAIATNFTNVRRPPGDRITIVTRLFPGDSKCVFVETHSSLSAVDLVPSPPAASEYWELLPKRTGIDPRHLNPTPWALSFNQAYVTPTTIPNQCDVS